MTERESARWSGKSDARGEERLKKRRSDDLIMVGRIRVIEEGPMWTRRCSVDEEGATGVGKVLCGRARYRRGREGGV